MPTFDGTFGTSDVQRLTSGGYAWGEWLRIVVDEPAFQVVAYHDATPGSRVRKWSRRDANGVTFHRSKRAALAQDGDA